MPFEYTINKKLGIVEERWTGSIKIEDMREGWRRLFADKKVLKARRNLVDLRKAKLEFRGADLDMLVRSELLPRVLGLDWKTAIVAEDPVQFGVGRQSQAFTSTFCNTSVFEDYDKAKSWLVSK